MSPTATYFVLLFSRITVGGIVVLLLWLMLGCSRTTAYVGIYDNLSGQKEFLGEDPVAFTEVKYHINQTYSCSWLHISHYFVGAPFDNKEEGQMDLIGCGMRVW